MCIDQKSRTYFYYTRCNTDAGSRIIFVSGMRGSLSEIKSLLIFFACKFIYDAVQRKALDNNGKDYDEVAA